MEMYVEIVLMLAYVYIVLFWGSDSLLVHHKHLWRRACVFFAEEPHVNHVTSLVPPPFTDPPTDEMTAVFT